MDDKFLQFKKECRQYMDYVSKVERLKDQLEQLQYKINGVHSTDFETTYKRVSRDEKSIIPEIEAKKELLNQLHEYEQKLKYIDDTIMKIPFPAYRVYVWEVLVMNKKYSELAEKYGYNQESFRKSVVSVMTDVLEAQDNIDE